MLEHTVSSSLQERSIHLACISTVSHVCMLQLGRQLGHIGLQRRQQQCLTEGWGRSSHQWAHQSQ